VFITPEKPSTEETGWGGGLKGGNRRLRLKQRKENLNYALTIEKQDRIFRLHNGASGFDDAGVKSNEVMFNL
jgi:hypothetical protein